MDAGIPPDVSQVASLLQLPMDFLDISGLLSLLIPVISFIPLRHGNPMAPRLFSVAWWNSREHSLNSSPVRGQSEEDNMSSKYDSEGL